MRTTGGQSTLVTQLVIGGVNAPMVRVFGLTMASGLFVKIVRILLILEIQSN